MAASVTEYVPRLFCQCALSLTAICSRPGGRLLFDAFLPRKNISPLAPIRPISAPNGWPDTNDPQFEQKAADIIGLYLNPPQHAAVFCVDEKTAIQALDRMDPVLPLSPGRAERHGSEYYRHGTLSLYAALNVKTGQVQGKTAKRHASADFITFLTDLIGKTKWARQIHIVLDNLSAHKTQAVEGFLAAHPKVRFHFTPTYSSWLNQVEIWFAKIERDVIARGDFTLWQIGLVCRGAGLLESVGVRGPAILIPGEANKALRSDVGARAGVTTTPVSRYSI